MRLLYLKILNKVIYKNKSFLIEFINNIFEDIYLIKYTIIIINNLLCTKVRVIHVK